MLVDNFAMEVQQNVLISVRAFGIHDKLISPIPYNYSPLYNYSPPC